MTIKLSVVVSCYNQEDYISECLDSIFNQKTDFNFEVIVADDFSSDGTREVIKKCCDKYSNKIRVLYQKKNVGAARNYIALHNLALGEYVSHIDGDDIMLSGKLQAQVDVMDTYPDCNIVFHQAEFFSDDNKYIAKTGQLFFGDIFFLSLSELARWGTIAVHSSYMYRRSTRLTRAYNKDFMEWFFAMESLIAGGRAAFINKVMVRYRCNQSGNNYLSSLSGRKKAYLILINDVMNLFEMLPSIRADLYVQQTINIAMYARFFKKIDNIMFTFLLKNIFYFNVFKFIQAVRVRKMIGPLRKNR